MANVAGPAALGLKGFKSDILIQSPNPRTAADFYVEQLGFTITAESPQMLSLHGPAINLFIEEGPSLGPVLEVIVDNVEWAKTRLLAQGCILIKDEPHFPRCYLQDPNGLLFNLTT